MNNNYINLIISYLILFPSGVILENIDYDDGVVNNFSNYIIECMTVLVIGSVISIIIFGISKLFKKDFSFITILYRVNFFISIIVLLICSHIIRYL